MNVHDNDWLDQRLAAKDYLPDDGFTAQVMERLPQKQPASAGQLRWRILSLSVALAFGVFVLQVLPLFREINPLAARFFSPEGLAHLVALCEQPTVLYSAAAGIVLLGFATIPILNRLV
jgi:hypothetical protein